jgi:hypothetical protein
LTTTYHVRAGDTVIVDPEPVTPPPPVITPVPTTTPFLGYPTSAALAKSGGGLEIKNLSFRGGGVALVISNAASPYIHDCDFADAVGGIFLLNCTNVRVERCRFRNIGDGTIGSGHSNYVQLNNCHGGAIRANKAIGGNTEDKISVYRSGGNSATDPLIVEDNQLDGLNANTADAKAWTRGSGTGIILGDGSVGDYIVVRNNTLLRPGQVGIQIIGGIGHQVYGNVLYADPRSPLTDNNVGMSSYAGSPKADVHNNRVYWRKNSGVENSHWWGAGTITDHPSSTDPLGTTGRITRSPRPRSRSSSDARRVSTSAPFRGTSSRSRSTARTSPGAARARSCRGRRSPTSSRRARRRASRASASRPWPTSAR